MSQLAPRRPWRRLAAVAVLAVASLSIAGGPVRSSQAAGASLSATGSASAPGMLRVAWSDVRSDPDGTMFRLRWWVGTDISGAPTGSVVMSNRYEYDAPQRAVVIPGLTAAAHTVVLDVVTFDAATSTYTAVNGSAEQATGTVQGTPAAPCGGTIKVCGTFTGAADAAMTVAVWTGPVTSSNTVGTTFNITLSSTSWWTDNAGTTNDWTRIRLNFIDRKASIATTWWAAFGDAGLSYETATELLVPTTANPAKVNLGTIAPVTGTAVSGRLTKSVSGASTPLTSSDLSSALCVQVQRVTPEGPETATKLCPTGLASGFGATADPATWKLALRPGSYRIRFVDETTKPTFAAHWWRADGTRGESASTATIVAMPGGQSTGFDGVLRPAAPLTVRITDVPASYSAATFVSVQVVDDDGNWRSGTGSVDVNGRVLVGSVDGLAAGRLYRVFVWLFDPNGGENTWWLVGGGTVEDATRYAAGTTASSPWPALPLLVTLHRPDGQPYGAGEACIALRLVGSPSTTAAASACVGSTPGLVRLQRVPSGNYRVVVYRKDPATGAVIGNPLALANHVITPSSPPTTFDPTYTYGISDVSRLSPGARINAPYDPVAAVVIP